MALNPIREAKPYYEPNAEVRAKEEVEEFNTYLELQYPGRQFKFSISRETPQWARYSGMDSCDPVFQMPEPDCWLIGLSAVEQ